MERLQKKLILQDLKKKIVFLSGPRQVGKTWLSREIAKEYQHPLYLNYDRWEDRKIIQRESWLQKTDLLILDELHKMPRWKNYLKGIFDTRLSHLHILVTGSARLEIFRQTGDSLAGRFFRHRLLPLTPAEIPEPGKGTLERFMTRGGFPEPYLSESDTEADRWRLQYIDGLIRTDILDFEKIHDFKAIQLVLDLLRKNVSSPVSYTGMAEDIGISPNTVRKYIHILESLYILFKVTPYAKNIARSLLKQPKIYFFDTGLVEGNDGKKFENLVAVSLLKYAYALEDYKGKETVLHYMRTKEGLEIDFLLATKNETPQMIEVKLNDTNPSSTLIRFHHKYRFPAIQVVKELKREQKDKNIIIREGLDYLKGLWLSKSPAVAVS